MMTKYIIFIIISLVTCAEGCGISKYSDAGDIDLPPEAQISGGIETRPNEFPWQVSLRYTTRPTYEHFCGGTIITESWIMTAAHCLRHIKKPLDIFVVVGEHNVNATSHVRKSHLVEKFIVHENFDSPNNDIALIKVTSTIDFNVNVAQICVPKTNDLYVHRKSIVSGWGELAFEGTSPTVLMYTSLNITTNELCERLLDYPVTENMMCAIDNRGGTNRDACQGDSGGPMTVKDSSNVFSVVGIVSVGIGCASGYPGIYTRVSHFLDWINDKITSE